MYLPPFHVHADVITVLFLLTFSYLYAVNRLGPILAANRPTSGKTQAIYLAGVATIWIASGWPVHDIAEKYLFSVHMVQHILLEMVAPPLLLLSRRKREASAATAPSPLLPQSDTWTAAKIRLLGPNPVPHAATARCDR